MLSTLFLPQYSRCDADERGNVNSSANDIPSQSDSSDGESSFLRQQRQFLHPGHCLLIASLPFCYGAYQSYHQPLEDVVENVLRRQPPGALPTDLKLAEEGVRRAVGSAVAARALRVATLGSFGLFGIAGALTFYISGCQTFEEAITSTRQWAHTKRRTIDSLMGVQDRVDRDHPEVVAVSNMSHDQQLEHFSKTYLPEEDWEAEETTEKS